MQSITSNLGRAWRLIGTAISFGLFGLGGILLSLTVFPIIWISVRNLDRRRKIGRAIVCRAFWLFVQIMRSLRVLDYEIRGDVDSLKTNTLVVANHPSLIDVVFLIGLFRGIDCVVKSAMWSNPFTTLTVQSAGYIRNDSPDILMDECINRLKSGRNLILFPEGTRSIPNQPLNFKRGAATIAIRASAMVLPVRILCDPPTLLRGEKWYRIPKARPRFVFEILPAIASQTYLERAENEKAASVNLTKHLKEILTSDVEINSQNR